MEDFEKLGAFYLGRPYDLKNKQRRDGLVLYDSKDLVTHAVCVGMTGSGKTGLCVGLLEEAAIDGVPAIVIDPKGDLANLLLTFPDLQANDFRPWINEFRRPGPDGGHNCHRLSERKITGPIAGQVDNAISGAGGAVVDKVGDVAAKVGGLFGK